MKPHENRTGPFPVVARPSTPAAGAVLPVSARADLFWLGGFILLKFLLQYAVVALSSNCTGTSSCTSIRDAISHGASNRSRR